MKNINIFDSLNSAVIFSHAISESDPRDIRIALEAAVCKKVSLKNANLNNRDLSGANLSGADLRGADLSYSFLDNCNLIGADLTDSILLGANLRGAALKDCVLYCADLRSSNLDSDIFATADVTGARILGANVNGQALSVSRRCDTVISGHDYKKHMTLKYYHRSHFVIDDYEYRTIIVVENQELRNIIHECWYANQLIKVMPPEFFHQNPYRFMTQEEFAKFLKTTECFVGTAQLIQSGATTKQNHLEFAQN